MQDVKLLRSAKYIGKSSADRIEEFLRTGKIAKFEEELRDADLEARVELCSVHGIGPRTAGELIKAGIRGRSNLVVRAQADPEELRRRFGVNPAWLKFDEEFRKPVGDEERAELLALMQQVSRELGLRVEPVGGARRQTHASHDADFLFSPDPAGRDPEDPELNEVAGVAEKLTRRLKALGVWVDGHSERDTGGPGRSVGRLVWAFFFFVVVVFAIRGLGRDAAFWRARRRVCPRGHAFPWYPSSRRSVHCPVRKLAVCALGKDRLCHVSALAQMVRGARVQRA